MKTKKSFLAVFVFIALTLATLSFAACSGAFSGEGAGETGTITIDIGGAQMRAVGLPYPPTDHPEILSELVLRIKLENSARAQNHTLAKGETSARFSVAAGHWRITVDAYHEGDLYATGSGSADVKARQSNQVTINMSKIEYTYTVTFKDGDTALKTETVIHGGNATAPTYSPPNKTSGYLVIYDGWDKALTNITADTTINAKWRAYNIGEEGPGGGKIFYRSEKGFIMIDDDSTAYYLEAAPVDVTGTWALTGSYVATNLIGTSADIGAGRRNTALIIAAAVDNDGTADTAPIANACDTYVSPNATDDWFLPSHSELLQLVAIKEFTTFQNSEYWSSTEGSATGARMYHLMSETQYMTSSKTNGQPPAAGEPSRPIRAF